MTLPPESDYPSFGSADTQPLRHPPGRRKFIKWLIGGAVGIGIAEKITDAIILKKIYDSLTKRPPVTPEVPTDELVRGILIGAFDEKGKPLPFTETKGEKLYQAPGQKMFLIFSEIPGTGNTISEVECTGHYKDAPPDNTDNPGGWPIIGKLKKPNKGRYYAFVANMDNLDGLGATEIPAKVPPGSPFQISVNVSGNYPPYPLDGGKQGARLPFKKNGEPGPINFIRK